MNLTAEHIATITHAANRALRNAIGEVMGPEWSELDTETKQSAIEGVEAANTLTPEQLHQKWYDFKIAHGWVYGDVKDDEAKTHPCLVPYDQLPDEQKYKDALFQVIVRTMTSLGRDE